MDDIELYERIATIETKLEHFDEELDGIRKDGESRSVEVHEINSKLDNLNNEMARYRGFVGGILLVATALVSFFKLFWDDIVKFVQRG